MFVTVECSYIYLPTHNIFSKTSLSLGTDYFKLTFVLSCISGQECQMTPVIHVLTHSGCKPKAIPSFACIGKCSSYVQVRLAIL